MIGMVALCVALAALLLAFFAWQQAKGAMRSAYDRAEKAIAYHESRSFPHDEARFVRRDALDYDLARLARAIGYEWYSEPPKSGWRKAGKR